MFLLVISGCQRRQYEIELKPVGSKLERRFTFKGTLDRAELERISKAYGLGKRLPSTSSSVQGSFSGRMPQDVGGAGDYVRYESSLGAVALYVERFRGNDDLYGQLEERRKSVDQLIDLLVGWFETELKDEPGFRDLRNFLNTTLRRDAQNLSLYGWSLSALAPDLSEGQTAEIALRGAHYLVEHGYASYEDAPALYRAIGHDNGAAVLKRIRALVVARMGGKPRAEISGKLAFLSDLPLLQKSWQHYFEATDYFLKRKDEFLRRIEKREKAARNATHQKDSPPPTWDEREHLARAKADVGVEILTDLLATAMAPFLSNILEGWDRVNVSLAAPRAPFWTNGKWLPEKKRVDWSHDFYVHDAEENRNIHVALDWPKFCFAVWNEPNEETQKKLFGTVAVNDKELLNYCIWYQALTSQEKQEWDAFVPTLKSDQPSRARLSAFRFSNEPANKNLGNRLAAPGVEVIFAAFKL
jgi:hypothetical protein